MEAEVSEMAVSLVIGIHYWKTGYGNQLEMALDIGFPTGSRQPRPMDTP